MVSLLVTVTVESDMPRGEVQARTSLRNLEGVSRLQRLCERFGVLPTYLLSYPVAARKEGELFAGMWKRGRCEVGACLQPWTTPPFDVNEDRLVAISPDRIPASAVDAKLATLTETIETRFGRRPKAHRAAWFGLNGACLQTLERLHYEVDSSVTPFIDHTARGGPDWRQAPEAPYFPDRQRPAARGSSPVLEVPVTVAWDRELPPVVARTLVKSRYAPVAEALANRWHPITRIRTLDPVENNVADLRHLSRVLVRRGLPSLNLKLRSNELWPGESRRCPTARDVDLLFETLEGYLRFAVDDLRAVPRTLSGFARHYLES